MVNSGKKGNASTRLIGAILGEWWRGKKFERRKDYYQGSDLIVPDDFPFAVEVKDWKELRIKHFFNPTALLKSFWEQARNQAEKEGKRPLLICKSEGTWFALTSDMWSCNVLELRLDGQLVYVRTLSKFQDLKEVIKKVLKCK